MALTIGDHVERSHIGIGQEQIKKISRITKVVIDIVVYQNIKVDTTKAYRHKIWIGKSKDWLLDR